MSELNPLQGVILRLPKIAAGAYFCLVLLMGAATWDAVASFVDRGADLTAAREILDQLEGRKSSPLNIDDPEQNAPVGSPLLEGPTVTVAGASLLQRVADAVAKVGGNVLSSQVELQGVKSKAGFVAVIANCEIDQLSLQKLLYDLEAGMPFLFIDQLSIQAPLVSPGQEERLRIRLAISGQWRGAR